MWPEWMLAGLIVPGVFAIWHSTVGKEMRLECLDSM